MAKKKQYVNLQNPAPKAPTVNKMVDEAKKYIADDAKKAKSDAKKLKSVIKARKNNSVKPRLSEVPTFGEIVPANQMTRYGGFTYKLTLTHPKAPGLVRYYYGKKGWNTGSDWHYYQSSSTKVMEHLNHCWVITYEILGYYMTEYELGQAEIKLIVQSWKTPSQRDLSLNFGIPCGARSMSRYVWCKKYMNQIDKRF